MSFDDIIGIHDLVVHDYGPGRLMISLHAEVPGGGDIYRLHDTIDRAMFELDRELGCESVIHMDPVDTENKELVTLREEVAALAVSIDERIDVHDLRLVPGHTHSNLIFDILAPFRMDITDEELKAEFCRGVHERHPDYHCIIHIDRPYV
jgi:divalent metal cation (Fe/Co/Zn/Cd) transporter